MEYWKVSMCHKQVLERGQLGACESQSHGWVLRTGGRECKMMCRYHGRTGTTEHGGMGDGQVLISARDYGLVKKYLSRSNFQLASPLTLLLRNQQGMLEITIK